MKFSLNDNQLQQQQQKQQQKEQPYLLYGTAWKKEDTARYVKEAVEAGFRYIDTACQPKHYNEAGVGNGWVEGAKSANLSRDQLFLQTKFTSLNGQDKTRLPYDIDAPLEKQVRQSVATSLENLQTTYLDRVVLHSPMRTFEATMQVWRVLESFVEEGTIRSLGVSNCYDLKLFQRIYETAEVKPSALQNRFYRDSSFDVGLRKFCKEKGILYQSFWTLTANRHALASREAKKLALKKELTPQTLMYAYMMTLGHTPLSGTTNPNHMAEDVAVMKRFQSGEEILTVEEMRQMDDLLGVSDFLSQHD